MADAPRESGSWKNPWPKLPTWAKWTIGIVGAIVLLGIGGAIGSSEEGGLKDEVAELETRLASAHEERAEALEKAERIEGLQSRIVGKARRRAQEILSGAKAESKDAENSLSSLESEVESIEGELASVEGSLEGAEETKAKSTIPGDGTFRAEADYIPGTYQSSGGNGCYWATLNSADPFDIASNENATGQTIANIDTPYFETKGCGTWKRIGE